MTRRWRSCARTTGWKSLSEPANDQASSPSGGGGDGAHVAGTHRVRLVGPAALVVAMVLVAVADFGRLRDGIFDLYQRAIPREVERFPARIVEIDDASLAHVGPWPWPRSLLACLAQNVVDRGALSVGFDVLFPEPDRHSATHFVGLHDSLPEQTRETLLNLPDPDQALAAVIGRSPIVLGRVGINDALAATTGDPEQFPIEAEFVGGEPSGLLSFESGIANIADLDEVAAGHGMLNGAPDRDGIIRRVPLVTRVGGRLTPLVCTRATAGRDRCRRNRARCRRRSSERGEAGRAGDPDRCARLPATAFFGGI